MSNPRYQVKPGPRHGVWTVVDTQTGEVIMRERDEAMIRRYAEARNNMPEPVAKPAQVNPAPPAETTPAPHTGWSKAARRRAGRPNRDHPLGKVTYTGRGFTEYEDTAFGGGRVQIWDES